MKKFKITDGFIRKVEKRLLKVAQKECEPDGIFVCLDGIQITAWEDSGFSLELQVRWGKMADGNRAIRHEEPSGGGEGRLHLLAGQY